MSPKVQARSFALTAALIGVALLAVLALTVLFSSSAPAHAQGADSLPTYPPDIFREGSLNASIISGDRYSFSGPYGYENLTFHVANGRNSPLELQLAVDQDDQWNVIDDLGSLGPGETGDFTYTAGFNYTGKTNETDTFGVIGTVGARYVGRTFVVDEDWSPYERSLKSSLSIVGVPLSIVMLIILGIVIAGALATALHARYGEDSEYTLRTLFFPIMRARPLAEKIADIILTPFFWLAELLLGAVLVLLILAVALTGTRPDLGILIFFVGGVAAIFMPVIFLVLAWLADYYKREPFRFVVAMFMWGVMATLFAFFINTTVLTVVELLVGSAGIALTISAVLFAPVVEETIKGLGLLVLSGHHEYDSAFDGILFGFAVGMGFAAVENWLYFVVRYSPVTAGGLAPWAYLILYRSLLGSLSHGCFTAATGGVIGFFKSRPNLRHHAWAAFAIGLPIAMILHGTGNLVVVIDSIMESAMGLPVPVFDPLYTLVLTTIYIIIGAILQLRLKDRLTKRGPGVEG